ncbi:MAG: ParB/RepB/Spo0J family partition protein, partial [Oscillospiraceae bacterium]|nr:ParB/RepB/Spo0J family partition protein [Oscillospiraceae bacterium]
MAKDTKKGLGTGLSALFGEDILESEESGELIYLPISKIEPRADQPRSYFDDEALQELAESIGQYGLIQPITVRKLDSGYYQIIAGERRWRACRMARLDEVPVRVIDADDRRVAELALVENLQREDLNPIEEAKGYKALIDEYGLTQDDAARSVGKSRPTVTNSLRLLLLPNEVLEYVERGVLSAGHARALLAASTPELQIKVAQQVVAGGLSVRKTEQLAAKANRD